MRKKAKAQSNLFDKQTVIAEVIKVDEGIPEPAISEQRVMRISQSLMKSVRDYLDGGACGVMIREQYIKGRLFDAPSKSMKLGIYFEYILTGALPKSGITPQPEFMKTPVNANVKAGRDRFDGLGIKDMYEPYREAHENAAKVKAMWVEMGLEIALDKEGRPLVGWRITKGRHEGTIDVVLRATRDIKFSDGFSLKEGDLISGDIKYSGLKDDKWSVHGWQRTDIQKIYHGTQAKEYKYLSSLDSTFWVVDPKGKYVLFFWCIIDQSAIEAHLEEANELHKRLIELDEIGMLEPRPEFNKCADCALFDECVHKHTFPHPVAMDLRMGN